MKPSGRPGLSFDAVAAAAAQLVLRGESPTLRAVRAELGSGSLSTIQKHLSAWQASGTTSEHSVPPNPELQQLIQAEIARCVGPLLAQWHSALEAEQQARRQLEQQVAALTDQLATLHRTP